MNQVNPRKKKRRYSGMWWALTLLLLASSALIFLRGQHTLLSRWGLEAVSSLQRGVSLAKKKVKERSHLFSVRKELEKKYLEAIEKLRAHRGMERELRRLVNENETLREQLQLSRRTHLVHRVAEVVGKEPGNFFTSLVLDKGENEGIGVGLPVLSSREGSLALVGKVSRVSQRSSLVVPIVSKDVHIVARSHNKKYEGLVSGMGDGTGFVIMDYVNKSHVHEILKDDLIVTSALSSRYPEGLPIGHVQSVTSRKYDTSLRVNIKPIIDFSRLAYVLVLVEE